MCPLTIFVVILCFVFENIPHLTLEGLRCLRFTFGKVMSNKALKRPEELREVRDHAKSFVPAESSDFNQG
jgi:hypothetical protein